MAREAVRKSLVLLKNGENAANALLLLPKKESRILVGGSHANNLGINAVVGPSLGKDLAETATLLITVLLS